MRLRINIQTILAFFLCSAYLNAQKVKKNSYIFSPEPNGLSFADHYGKLSAWYSVGDLKLAEGVALPLKFNFHSAQDKVGNSILGWNWWFPAVESSVVKKTEQHVIAHMIGGSRLHLFKTAKDSNLYRSNNHAWEGRNDGEGGFKIVNAQEKWEFDFKKGKLQRMKMPNERRLRWKYDLSGYPESISSDDGSELLRIEYDSPGKPTKVLFEGDKGHKIVNLHVGDPSEVGLPLPVMALKSFDSPLEKVEIFNYQLNKEKDYVLIAKHLAESSSANKNEIYRWGLEDSLIKFAKGEDYTISLKEKRPLIKKVDSQGKESSYIYNMNKGESVFRSGSKIIRRRYIMTFSPAYGKCSKVSVMDSVFNESKVIKLYYDEKGTLIKSAISKNNHEQSPLYSSNEASAKFLPKGLKCNKSGDIISGSGKLLIKIQDKMKLPIKK